MSDENITETTQLKKASKDPDVAAGTVTFNFADDETLVFNLDSVSPEMQKQLALHGASQKIGDSYSGKMSPAEARGLAQKTIDKLVEGNWKTPSAGGSPRVSLLVESVTRAFLDTKATDDPEIARARAEEIVEGLDKDGRSQLSRDPAVKRARAAIQLERAEKASGESVLANAFGG